MQTLFITPPLSRHSNISILDKASNFRFFSALSMLLSAAVTGTDIKNIKRINMIFIVTPNGEVLARFGSNSVKPESC